MTAKILKPGLLIALKSTVSGGVQYRRVDLEMGKERSRWDTIRVTEDPEEHDRAVKARGKAVSEIRSVCSFTTFGLLCPEDREADLDAAIVRARAIVTEHNATARATRVSVFALKGRIASTDEEAARALSEEVTSLMSAMTAGIDKLDVKAIRDAATKAQELGAMLDETQVGKVAEAVEQARRAARTIVKRVEKDGEEAAKVLQDIQRGAIDRARIAFLDYETGPTVAEPDAPVNAQRFADLDPCGS